MYPRSPESIRKSIDLFERAVKADPDYALAYTGLSEANSIATGYGVVVQPAQAYAAADAASRKAVELDDKSSEAHTARALALCNLVKWEDCQKEFLRALALNPNDPSAHYFLRLHLPYAAKAHRRGTQSSAGRVDARSAVAGGEYELRRLAALGPSNIRSRRTVEEIDRARPGIRWRPLLFVAILFATGNYRDALAEMKKLGMSSETGNARDVVKQTYGEDAQGYLRLLSDLGPTVVAPANYAAAYAAAGDREKTFEFLQRAYAEQADGVDVLCPFPRVRSDAKRFAVQGHNAKTRPAGLAACEPYPLINLVRSPVLVPSLLTFAVRRFPRR
jgi:tetratricopeptide (TPR) repeat protein